MSDWRNDSFKVGNKEILYTDVKLCLSEVDKNGNPVYKIRTKNNENYKIDGIQAYAFDTTKVIDDVWTRAMLNIS